MRKITVKFGGKTWTEVEANNSGWIAPGAPADLVAALKSAPRAGVTSKGVPIVKSDDGTNIYLGAAELRNEGESVHAAGGSGSGAKPVSRIPEDIARRTVALKGLPADLKEFYQGIVDEYEAQKTKKLDTARESLKALGLDDAAIEATLALKK